MKTMQLLTIVALISTQGLNSQTTFVVNENGFAYDPQTLTIHTNDSVKFNGSSTHPIQQVSEPTYTANGITPLSGGFAFADGKGTLAFKTAGTFYYVCTSHVESLGMKGKIIVQGPNALGDVAADVSYSLYPVPFTGNKLTVSLGALDQRDVEVIIYDMAGNLRLSSSGNLVGGIHEIDCSSLPNGLFLVKMKTGEHTASTKIVKY